MNSQPETLGEVFPKELQRCRELLVTYIDIGPVGTFAAMTIRNIILEAEKAMLTGDVVAMLRVYEKMKGCE